MLTLVLCGPQRTWAPATATFMTPPNYTHRISSASKTRRGAGLRMPCRQHERADVLNRLRGTKEGYSSGGMFNRELSRCGTVHKRHCLTMVVAILACVVASPRPASATETYRLSAKRVAFYTNTFILQGSGNVQAEIGGEGQISAGFLFRVVRGH